MGLSTPKTFRFNAGFGQDDVLAMRRDLAKQLHEEGVSGDAAYALINVLDEFCCNMMEHAQVTWAEVKVMPDAESLRASIQDDGVEFDPVKAVREVDPESPASVSDRKLGLYLIGLLAKDLVYQRQGNINFLEFSMKR
jgi:anti-sigma regulatory factor (Ser/Thr protein kinase)